MLYVNKIVSESKYYKKKKETSEVSNINILLQMKEGSVDLNLLIDVSRRLYYSAYSYEKKGGDPEYMRQRVLLFIWFCIRYSQKPIQYHLFDFGYDIEVRGNSIREEALIHRLHQWKMEEHTCIASEWTKLDQGLTKLNPNSDKKWAWLLNWYIDHLPVQAKKLVTAVLKKIPNPDICEVRTIEYLTFVSETVKAEFPDMLDQNGRYLIDMKNMGGYDTYKNRIDPLQPWYEKSVEKQAILPDQLDKIKTHIDRAIEDIQFKYHHDLSVKSFVKNRGYWEGSGAASGHSFEVVVNGKKVKLRTKTGAMLKYTNKEIEDIMFNDLNIISKTFQKADEPVKSRIITNVGMNSYLRVSYLNEFISRLPDWTPLERKGEDVQNIWETLCNTDQFGVSLDFEGFDIHIKESTFVYAVNKLMKKCVDAGADERIFVAERDSTVTSIARKVGWEGKYNGWLGLPSGHRWTALIGTIINRAVSEYIRSELNVQWTSYHQGDDIAIYTLYRPNLNLIQNIVSSIGMKINAAKTVAYQGGVEFLRNWCYKGKAIGYPARLVRNLAWFKPGSGLLLSTWLDKLRDVTDGYARARAWGLRGVRSALVQSVRHVIPKYIEGDDRRKIIIFALSGSSSYGPGVGNKFCSFYPTLKPVKPEDVNCSVRLPGARGLRLRKLLQTEIPLSGIKRDLKFKNLDVCENATFSFVTQKVRNPRILPSRKTEDWWEKSVNIDTYGYKPEFVSDDCSPLVWTMRGEEIPQSFVRNLQDTVLPDLSYIGDKILSSKIAKIFSNWHSVRYFDIFNLNCYRDLSTGKIIKNRKIKKYDKNLTLGSLACQALVFV